MTRCLIIIGFWIIVVACVVISERLWPKNILYPIYASIIGAIVTLLIYLGS